MIRFRTALAVLLLAASLGCGKQPPFYRGDTAGGGKTPAVPGAERANATNCRVSSTVWCIVDTAVIDQPNLTLNPTARLLWFGRSGDSLSMDTNLGTVQTSIGSIVDSLHNNVSYFSGHLARDGAIMVWIDISDERGGTVPYMLRVAVESSNNAIPRRPTNLMSRLTLSPDRTRKFAEISVVPLSELHAGIDRSAWKVTPGTYKVVMTQDSLYEVCVLPCVSPDTVTLKTRQAVRWVY